MGADRSLGPRRLSLSLRARDPMPPRSHLFIMGWTGMRGIVSLASALALPLTTADGTPFPFRAEITLITFMVILVTLVLQGLSLPALIRALKVKDDESLEHEEREARERATLASLARLNEIANEDWSIPEQVEQLRELWGSQPGDGPDGFAIGRSGRIYLNLYLANQVVVISPDGEELTRIGEKSSGLNGTPIPFDGLASAVFLGERLLVTNHAVNTRNPNSFAILDIAVKEEGQALFRPSIDRGESLTVSRGESENRRAPEGRGARPGISVSRMTQEERRSGVWPDTAVATSAGGYKDRRQRGPNAASVTTTEHQASKEAFIS